MNLQDLISSFLGSPSQLQFVTCTFVTFVAVYRWGLNRWLRYNFFSYKKYKVLECETCFAFWLCLLISINFQTAVVAYLIFNFYEKNRSN